MKIFKSLISKSYVFYFNTITMQWTTTNKRQKPTLSKYTITHYTAPLPRRRWSPSRRLPRQPPSSPPPPAPSPVLCAQSAPPSPIPAPTPATSLACSSTPAPLKTRFLPQTHRTPATASCQRSGTSTRPCRPGWRGCVRRRRRYGGWPRTAPSTGRWWEPPAALVPLLRSAEAGT